MAEVAAFKINQPKNKTLIHIILDETGSMNSCLASTISSFNEFIDSQKKLDSDDCKVGLTTFSTQYYFGDNKNAIRHKYENVDIANVTALSHENYSPNGGTNLYDAIGETLNHLKSKVDDQTDVLIVFITDGEENSSNEYKIDDVKSLIKSSEEKGWTFVYLGANQDAWQVGAAFGLSKGQTMSYSTANMAATMDTLSTATSAYRSSMSLMRNSGSTEKVVARGFFDGDQNEQK